MRRKSLCCSSHGRALEGRQFISFLFRRPSGSLKTYYRLIPAAEAALSKPCASVSIIGGKISFEYGFGPNHKPKASYSPLFGPT
jgi:hypothetical protein